MSIRIWIGDNPRENTRENEMASKVTESLVKEFRSIEEEIHLLYDFSIPGFQKTGERPYKSHLDMAVLKANQLVILELKNYKGRLEVEENVGRNGEPLPVDLDHCEWRCRAEDDALVAVKGGATGRNPLGQVKDYYEQMRFLLDSNRADFILKRRDFSFRKFVSALIVFPDQDRPLKDAALFQGELHSFCRIARVGELPEAILMRAAGRGNRLTGYEPEALLTKALKVREGRLVGNVPVKEAPPELERVPVTKVVHVQVPVEKKVFVEKTVFIRGEFSEILRIVESEAAPVGKIRQLADLAGQTLRQEIKKRQPGGRDRGAFAILEKLFPDNRPLAAHFIRLTLVNKAILEAPDGDFVTDADLNESLETACELIENLFNQPRPAELSRLCDGIVFREIIDVERRALSRSKPREAIRLLVTKIDSDERLLSGIDPDDPGAKEQTFRYSDGKKDDYFKDLPSLLDVGSTVEILFPRKSLAGDYQLASQVVLEPDYLVSPQQLGRASVYGNGEYYFWLDTLCGDYPAYDTDSKKKRLHFSRGNFANMSLAERAAGADGDADRQLKAFFRRNSLDLTSDEPPRDWFAACREADGNIRHTLWKRLQAAPYGIPPGSWQLEAPIFSPVCGISARLDAVSYSSENDKTTVLELKSGKWNAFSGKRDPKPEHLCQPIYYADLLHFSEKVPRKDIVGLLYYSKSGVPPTPETACGLLLNVSDDKRGTSRYVALRNRAIWLQGEMRNGGLRERIVKLTPEDFLDGPATGYWSKYTRPGLEKRLRPFHESSDLALSYFFRQLKFIADEETVSRLGDATTGLNGGNGHYCDSCLWRTPLPERREAGIGFSRLVTDAKELDELGRVTSLTLKTDGDPSNRICSIRRGDAVCLYRRDAERPDITKARLFAATVASIAPDKVTISLRPPQRESLLPLAGDGELALDPAPSTSMRSSYKGLWYFLTGNPHRQGLVLNTDTPATDKTAKLPIPDSERRYPGLSETLLRVWQARDLYLIWGPPGTGKTSHAMRALVDQALAEPGKNVLLLAYTYKAVDNICEMLEDRLRDQEPGGQYLRLGNPQKCAENLRDRMLENLDLRNREAVRAFVAKTRIVVSVISALSPSGPVFALWDHFDLAIVDEASQLLDTQILPLFCASRSETDKRPLVGKFVFIGDDMQLPAVVRQSRRDSEIREESLREHGFRNCRESFFARLRRTMAGEDPARCSILSQQFRMHPLISDFPRHFFYKELLEDGDAPHQRASLPAPAGVDNPFQRFLLSRRVGFVPVQDTAPAVNKTSESEARICAMIVGALLDHPSAGTDGREGPRPYEPGEIGIIVPFRNQIAKIRDELSKRLPRKDLGDILVDTVERFQGSERPVVLFSTVINYAGQGAMIGATSYEDIDNGLADGQEVDQKLNVAITRARERFYLVGKETALRGLRAYGDLLQFISDHDGAYEEEMPF